MRRYLLDTKPAQQFLNNIDRVRTRVDEARLLGCRVGICTPVLGELWSGVEGSNNREKNLQRLSHGLSRLILWPFDQKAAEEFGRIFIQLKRMDRPMQQIDIQIAAVALSLGNCTVVSGDSDLVAVPDLMVEDWSEEQH